MGRPERTPVFKNYQLWHRSMNKTHAVLFALMMLTVSLAGCFGNDDPVEDETPVETLDDWQVHFASSAADLPTCDSATDGRLYYVDADSEFQVCTSSGWDVIDVSGPAGQDGADGSQGAAGTNGTDGSDGTNGNDGISTLIRILSSTTCTTGGNSFEIGADNNGDGVLDITEVIVTVDICNGVAGPAGQDGIDGNDGTNGTDGVDGNDGNDGADGTNGTDGTDGNDGNSTLMVMTNLSSSSSNCWGDGGVQIDVGVDDNKNGVLDSSEIDDTTYICYGGDGQDGTDGADGNDGADGTNGTDGVDGNDGNDGADGTNGSASPNTMLTSISSPAASLGCNAGGRVMMQGLDNGDGGGTAQNGVLESGEVDYTTTYCSKYVIWQVDDIYSGTYSSSPGYRMAILVGDTLYFDAYDGSSGRELWAHDTSNASTWRVADIRSGTDGSNPGYYMEILVGDTLYFDANDGSSGRELWAMDIEHSIMYD